MTTTAELTDTIGGYNPDGKLSKWPCGSIFANEGERLYKLVREHKPKIVLAVGTYYGCGTSHIALALKHNGSGHVYSVDNCVEIGDKTGCMIPRDLMPWITLVRADALTYELPEGVKPDLLFEDGAHTTGFTATVLRRYPAPLVVVHDYCHRTAGVTVAPEFREVLGVPDEVFLEEPSDCGLAIKMIVKKEEIKPSPVDEATFINAIAGQTDQMPEANRRGLR